MLDKIKLFFIKIKEYPKNLLPLKILIHLTDAICLTSTKSFLHRKIRKPLFSLFHRKFTEYIYRSYMYDCSALKDSRIIQSDGKEPIWIFWYQGLDNAPDVVKVCYKSVKEHAGTHPVILLTKDNYRNYVSIPDYIEQKVKEKKITLTHFSDILRVCLIYEHGGLWMDSTLMLHYPLPDYVFNLPLFTRNIDRSQTYYRYPETTWCGFFIGGYKGSPYIKAIRDGMFKYWLYHNSLINYFIIDYFTAALRMHSIAFKEALSSIPYNNKRVTHLMKIINTPYNEIIFSEYVNENNFVSKLTYKKKVIARTRKNDLTFWGLLEEKYK